MDFGAREARHALRAFARSVSRTLLIPPRGWRMDPMRLFGRGHLFGGRLDIGAGARSFFVACGVRADFRFVRARLWAGVLFLPGRAVCILCARPPALLRGAAPISASANSLGARRIRPSFGRPLILFRGWGIDLGRPFWRGRLGPRRRGCFLVRCGGRCPGLSHLFFWPRFTVTGGRLLPCVRRPRCGERVPPSSLFLFVFGLLFFVIFCPPSRSSLPKARTCLW
ncbi:hypothetical protein C8R44DRAFT_38580 [Mycena epipterygia]|nr:hypothetical protein C8R44DRAFT_38580 [Mycena epipterygia]